MPLTERRTSRRTALLMGLTCLLLALLLDAGRLGGWLSGDGSIDAAPARTLILASRLVLAALGLVLSLARPRLPLLPLWLSAGAFLAALLLGLVGLQAFYRLPAVESGWRWFGTSLEQNQLGFRGHPIEYDDGDLVILLVGDSQVENVACAYDYMPERRLEHHLREAGRPARVFSLAAGGYGQDQQLLALREYYRFGYRADLVLLWQTLSNDVWNNTFPSHWPTNGTPKPTFWLEDGQLRGPSESIGEVLGRPRLAAMALLPRFTRHISARDTLWESRLPPPYSPLEDVSGPVNRDWQMRWEAGVGTAVGENPAIEKSHYALYFAPRSPRTEYSLELTRRLLGEIETEAVERGGRFAVFRTRTPPGESEIGDEVYVFQGRHYRTSPEQFDENLGWLDEGLTVLELAVEMEHWRVGPADGHLNEHANDQVMADLAARLEREGLLP